MHYCTHEFLLCFVDIFILHVLYLKTRDAKTDGILNKEAVGVVYSREEVHKLLVYLGKRCLGSNRSPFPCSTQIKQ